MSDSIYALAIPKWGIEMENGTVTEWHSEVGDTVTKGDELVDLESDKIINTLEATASGVLRRQFAEIDDTLVVGELIGIIADEHVSDDAIDAFVAQFNAARDGDDDADPVESEPEVESTAAAATPAVPESSAENAAPGKVRVSPPVRRKAEQLGVDISTVIGSGPGGRITSEDIDLAANAGDTAASDTTTTQAPVGEGFTATKLSAMQQTMARRLVESKQSIPHFYLNIDIELDALLAKRKELNLSQGQKLSINDMMVWCVARALQTVPKINAQLVDNEIRQFEHSDVSVAVATDKGLYTPVIRAAEEMTAVQIAAAIAEMVDKAKNNNLERDDITGGSFTVSNLGMYGVTSFEAIVNPPQVAILALGRADKKIVVRGNNETAVATVMSANLSCDHRVVDGALGGSFLSVLKNEIESLA